MNKSVILGASAFALILGGFLLINGVSAYRGDINVKGPNYSADRHEKMLAAFKNNDYQAWKASMGENGGRAAQVINQDNFAKFAQSHQLMLEGKYEEAQKIRQELGLGQGMGRGGRAGGHVGCPYNQANQ